MKKNKKMTSTKVNLETRISARIENDLYVAMRFIALSQSKTIEEKIAEMCKDEVAYVSKQKWFIELVENGGADNIMPLLNLLDRRRKIIIDEKTGKSKPNQVEFEDNYLGDKNDDDGDDLN